MQAVTGRAVAAVEATCLFAAAWVTVLSVEPQTTGWRNVVFEAAVLALCLVLAFHYNGLYDARAAASIGAFARRLLPSLALAAVLLAIACVLLPALGLHRRDVVLSIVAMVVVALIVRAIAWGVVRSPRLTRRVLILGAGPMTRTVIRELRVRQDRRCDIAVLSEDVRAVLDEPNARVAGNLEDLAAVLDAARPDRIVVALGDRRDRELMSVLLEARARGVPVVDAVDFYEALTGKIAIESLSPSSLVFARGFRRSRIDLTFRRAMNVALATLGLVALAPLLAVIAVIVMLDSRGPAFFVQRRAGVHGRCFSLVKFRTMHPGPDTRSQWEVDNLDRITRVGRVLRAFRLDELPQLVNVVCGDMDLVGPRPHPVSNVPLFRHAIPYYALRMSVRPGVTGWAQIRYGYANGLEEETEKMRYDLYYIKHRSAWLDARILGATVATVLGRRGTRRERPRATAPTIDVATTQPQQRDAA